jgi:hypothetical protein
MRAIGRGDAPAHGHILWIKPGMTDRGDECADVLQYKLGNGVFPQQTTGDQWFDEAQFESYRALGRTAGREAVRRVGGRGLREAMATADRARTAGVDKPGGVV